MLGAKPERVSPGARFKSYWSSLIFGWYTPVLIQIQSNLSEGKSPNIEQDDGIYPQLPNRDTVSKVDDVFDTIWKKRCRENKNDPNLVTKCLWEAFSPTFLLALLLDLVSSVTLYVGPWVLNLMIPYLKDPILSPTYGLGLTVLFFVGQVTTSLCKNHVRFINLRVASRTKTALVVAIFRKSLQIDSTYYADHPIGQVTNLMSTDAGRTTLLMEYLPMVVTTPFQLVLGIVMLWQLLGYSCLGGILVMIVSMPLSAFAAKVAGTYMKKLMTVRDERVNCNQEVISNMLTVKYQAWEDSFQTRTMEARNAEMWQLFIYKLANISIAILFKATPMLVSLTSFFLYVTVAGHDLDTQTALTALSVFNIIQEPITMVPMLYNFVIETSISIQRIQNYLTAPNFQRPAIISSNESLSPPFAIAIRNASFSYHKINEIDHDDINNTNNSELDSLIVHDAAKKDGDLEYGATATSVSNNVKTEDVFALKSINFECHRGDFVAVVGGVGSGKTSLLKAILGELQKASGTVEVGRDDVSYFNQDPFIMNDTVKGNIVFGRSNEDIDEELYRLAVKSSCLEHDFKMFSNGDQTEIGEKGINMSGGQKARIAIARAVYKDATISLLDDCLSAVDAHVGRELFEKCIIDVLLNKQDKAKKKKRTVVLATNALQYLSHSMVDRIIVMKDGTIVESGSYKELSSRDDSHFKFFLDSFNESMNKDNASTNDEDIEEGEENVYEEATEDVLVDIDCPSEFFEERRRSSVLSTTFSRRSSISTKKLRSPLDGEKVEKKKNAKLITDELAERGVGKVGWELYSVWLEAAGGLWIILPLFLVFAAPMVIDYKSNFWLSESWGPDLYGKDQIYYLEIYALLQLTGIIFGIFQSIVPVIFGLIAGMKFFSRLLNSLLAAPMSFYDTTPTGRILNRFTKDINTIDEILMSAFMQYMKQVFSVCTAIFVFVTVCPMGAFLLPFLGMFYKKQYDFYSQSNRELQRIDSVYKSPTFALFSEALNGFCTIRAFDAEPALLQKITGHINKQAHSNYLFKTGKAWLGLRLEFVGSLLILFACAIFIIRKESIIDGGGDLSSFANLRGMALVYLLQLSSALLYTVRFSSEFEAGMVSVERIRQYTQLQKEAPHVMPSDKLIEKKWPSKGSVEFRNVNFRYRAGTPLVLKGLNIKIPSGAKVGIVGRTGAGKSTVVNALTRIAELDSGQIVMDDIDIKSVGLKKLRSNIAVIPQDPVLFSGTIGTNLDPFKKHSETKLIDVLTRIGLYENGSSSSPAIKSLDDKVEQDGSNYSAGQRQLLIIGRALLDGASVVICDEATSSIDAEADSRIQRVFRTDFEKSTTLTVAHRLNTILDSTHILVMDDGKAVEFDSPKELLAKGGFFKDLVDKYEAEHKG